MTGMKMIPRNRLFFFLLFITQATNAHTTQKLYRSLHGTGQIRITTAGSYFLSDNWTAELNSPGLSAICIATSDVTLNLKGKSLSISTNSHTSATAGIELAPGVSNITITNGTIIGTRTHTPLPIGISGINNAHVTLKNLTITGCSESGISLSYGKGLTMKSITIRDTVNTHGSAVGLKLSHCTKIAISNSSIKTTRGGKTLTDFVAGIYIDSCNNGNLDQITTSNNKSIETSVYGIFLQNCSKFTCSQVYANQNTSKNSQSTCAGFFIVNSDENSFTQCLANNNVSTTAAVRGFEIQKSSDNIFRTCSALQNSAPQGSCIGFNNESSKYTAIHGCKAYDNLGGTTSCGFSSNASNDTHITKSKAIGNTTHNGSVIGIRFIGEIDGIIKKCTINTNEAPNGTAYGIALFKECFGTKILHNFTYKNFGQKQYGFYDDATYFTSFFRGNLAFNHGKTISDDHRILNSTATNYYIPNFRGSITNFIEEREHVVYTDLHNRLTNFSVNTTTKTVLHHQPLMTRSPFDEDVQ